MSETVDEKLVRHIGKLSRIALSEADVARFGSQLSAILGYFDKLKELDTDGVEPMAHALEFHNVLAEDRLGQSLTPEQALANAPARAGDLFKVPKVIGESQ
jgi:aspartyl-tRNA(Asn)/glutamyl-tRNA(Gln) amidotransferase subunit C